MIKFRIIYGEEGYKEGANFRDSVLSEEMGFPGGSDAYDDTAFHIAGRENGEVMCYGRMYKTADYTFSVDKMAVRKEDRMQYVGDTMLRAFEDRAVTEIGALIFAEAPENAWEFFLHEEYSPVGEEYEKDGVRYKKFKRDLTKIRGCRGCKK